MIRQLLVLLPAMLLVTGCAENTQVSDDLAEAQTSETNPTGRGDRVVSNPGERPVRIGEGGPRFDACQAVGQVTGPPGGPLSVLIAPFDAAERKDGLQIGQQVYICTRSHDQQWLGVVYAPTPAEGENAIDCGVSSPVRSKRNYDGPCASGWVESTFVKLVAG